MKERASFASLTKYGLLLGIILVVIALLHTVIIEDSKSIFSYLFTLLSIAAQVFFVSAAIKKAIEIIYFNTYKLNKGVIVGFYVGIVAGVFMLFYKYLDASFIRPEYYDQIAQQKFLDMKEIYQDDIERFYDQMNMMRKPIVIGLKFFFETVLVCGVVSLFIAPFYKKMAAQIAVPAENQEESQEEN